MQKHGIHACGKRKYRVTATGSKHNLPIDPNLLDRNFTPAALSQALVGDFTYIATGEGRLFLAVVIDLFSRKVNCWENACSGTLFGSLKVERLHGERFETIRAAKDAVIAWLLWYNQVRPHEALEMQTPASVYQPSPRPYPEQLPEVEYPDTMLARAIKSHGHFRWKKHDIFLSEVLWCERVGLLPVDGGCYTVYFAHVPLALFSEPLLRVMPLNKKKGASAVSFLRHERSIVRWEGEAGPGTNQTADSFPPSHRLDESQPVISRQVALQQSLPPLHQPVPSSTPLAGNVNRNGAAENQKLSGMSPV